MNSFQESEANKKDVSRRSNKMIELAHKMDASIREVKNKVDLNFDQSSIMDHSVNTEAGMRLIE